MKIYPVWFKKQHLRLLLVKYKDWVFNLLCISWDPFDYGFSIIGVGNMKDPFPKYNRFSILGVGNIQIQILGWKLYQRKVKACSKCLGAMKICIYRGDTLHESLVTDTIVCPLCKGEGYETNSSLK